MAVIELTVPEVVRTRGSGRARYILDGAVYVLTFQFNQREGRWTIDLADTNEIAITTGISAVCLWGLLGLITDARRPAGELMIVGPPGNQTPPSLTELGSTKKLYYYEAG